MQRKLNHLAYQTQAQQQRNAVMLQVNMTWSNSTVNQLSSSACRYIERRRRDQANKNHETIHETSTRCCNMFSALPEDIILMIFKPGNTKRGRYLLESKNVTKPKSFLYSEQPNGTMLNVSQQPSVEWILQNVQIELWPEQYWKTQEEFGKNWNAGSKFGMGVKLAWNKACKHPRNDEGAQKRFDIQKFKQDTVPLLKKFGRYSLYSKWLVPLTRTSCPTGRTHGTDSRKYFLHVYEMRRSRTSILSELHALLGKACTERLVQINTFTLPNRSEASVVFFMGSAIDRACIANDVLFMGFSGLQNDPRIEALCCVPSGAEVKL